MCGLNKDIGIIGIYFIFSLLLHFPHAVPPKNNNWVLLYYTENEQFSVTGLLWICYYAAYSVVCRAYLELYYEWKVVYSRGKKMGVGIGGVPLTKRTSTG